MTVGRPSDYTDELADAICERLATSSRGLEWLCNNTDEFPAGGTVWRWIAENEAFREKYTRAKERQAEFLADEILDISDDAFNDYRRTEDGRELPDHEHISRSKLRIDSRKWLMSKLLPKKYGDKLDLEHSGGVTVEKIERTIIDPANPDS